LLSVLADTKTKVRVYVVENNARELSPRGDRVDQRASNALHGAAGPQTIAHDFRGHEHSTAISRRPDSRANLRLQLLARRLAFLIDAAGYFQAFRAVAAPTQCLLLMTDCASYPLRRPSN
jgi:hypothetical protein